MNLITIDMDALARAIYSNTDASEQEARAIINTVGFLAPSESPFPATVAQPVAEKRLQWLHSPASGNVDGWEWGIFKVKWGSREGEHQIRHTFADFSDLDEAMATPSNTTAAQPCPSQGCGGEGSEAMAALVKEAFFEGFGSAQTYNDTLLNRAEDEWQESSARAALSTTKSEGQRS
jgi:hypothetical protein